MSSGEFKDHFSGHAALYRQTRPTYPDAFLSWLASLAPRTGLAWDCGCGNGQASFGLAPYFDKLVATDASAPQIEEAQRLLEEKQRQGGQGQDKWGQEKQQQERQGQEKQQQDERGQGKQQERDPFQNLSFHTALAEASPLHDQSVDLILVAQAAHWFDFDRFYKEVRRVLKPDGVIALICYGRFHIDGCGAAGDQGANYGVMDELLGAYWPPERALVLNEYKTIPFPFAEQGSLPKFSLKSHFNRQQMVNSVLSWSAAKRYEQALGKSPAPEIEERLTTIWPDGNKVRLIEWPISMRIGRRA